MKVRW